MSNLIRNTIYFNNLNDMEYQAILRCFNARLVEYEKGSTIVNIGDDANNIYIIASGRARSQAIDINGKLTIRREFYANDIFGLNYMPDSNLLFNEELIAIDDTHIIICDSFRFQNPCQNRCKRHIDCMVKTLSTVSSLLNKQAERVDVMCQSKTRSKIMAYLKIQAKNKKKYFTIPYNQSELAMYLGLERSALSYELNNMKREGIIDFDDKSYKIIKK